ncbi:MAG TPA: sigma-70 family RNA polymerase sigma factor [Pyrinomonadaceae bacterium]|jgi:RNA polymerase sigma-70 factor (ECF subfamily)|nr:sigma-70 family RNA polymerase sigma factor [Pyrinomonadaceae bacterium]
MSASPIALSNLSGVADRELVTRAVAGREDSFEELVRRYQRPIAAYVYRMVGDYDAALDLTQEVFIKVYNSLSRYRPEFKFSTWIYKIAHNSAVDHLRRHCTREQSLMNEFDGEQRELPIESRRPSPEQESERAERRAEIEQVVQGLPTAYRELVLLRHSHDLSYDEIALVTGLPLGTVKNRLFRAREVMRHQFVERGITGV